MPESIIVTIQYKDISGDFELPFQLPISVWIESLLDTIRSVFAQKSIMGENYRLIYNKIELQQEYSMAQYNIYDGAIITLELSE